MDANAVWHCTLESFSSWTAYFDVRNRESLSNPKDGRAKIVVEDTHHKVNVRVSPFHIADKAPTAVALLKKTERRVSVTMPMILHSPTIGFAMPDSQAKRLPHFQD